MQWRLLSDGETASGIGCRRDEFQVPGQLMVFGGSGRFEIAPGPHEPDLIVEMREQWKSEGDNTRLRGRGFVLSISPGESILQLAARDVATAPADSLEARRCREISIGLDSLRKRARRALKRLDGR